MSSWPLPVPGGPGILGCVPGALAPGPSLQESCSWDRAAPSVRSCCQSGSLSCSRGRPGRRFIPLGHVARSPRGACPLLVIPGTEGHHCPSWDPAQVPCQHLWSGKIGKAPASLGLGFPVLGALTALPPGPSPASRGGTSPWTLFYFFIFFRPLTLIEAQTLLTVAFQLFSL